MIVSHVRPVTYTPSKETLIADMLSKDAVEHTTDPEDVITDEHFGLCM